MPINRSQLLTVLKSIGEPKLVQESDDAKDSGLRVFTSEGGYYSETDDYLIDGPFEMSEEDYQEALRVADEDEDSETYWDPPEEHTQMVEAGCEPGVQYYRYQTPDEDDNPTFNEDIDELKQLLIDDIIRDVDCQVWEEMTDSELEEWYSWLGYPE
jgi:hypothetical protein